ncbi:hypothetical protein BGU88_19690 [Clostridioides difficile]|nr:hypothetical protein BGU88_19690 [Clostridioides difficile]
MSFLCFIFFFKAKDGIRDGGPSIGLGDVYKNQHPSRKTHRAVLEVEDIWNIISIGTRYIELVLLLF